MHEGIPCAAVKAVQNPLSKGDVGQQVFNLPPARYVVGDWLEERLGAKRARPPQQSTSRLRDLGVRDAESRVEIGDVERSKPFELGDWITHCCRSASRSDPGSCRALQLLRVASTARRQCR